MSNEVLKGIQVVDFSTMIAAPMTGAFLGEFGADVIKVEWRRGDPARGSVPHKDGISLMNKMLGRNKKLITLDFHHPEAVELLYELVKDADVVISNFRPQSLKRFRLDYDDLIKFNPNLIMLHFTAYGRTGLYHARPGYARVAEAYAGLTYFTGWPDRAPTLSGNWLADGIGGIEGAYAVMLALYHKKCTGEGQLIDLGLYEPLLRIMEDFVINYGLTGEVKERLGNQNSSAAPNGMYRTKDEKWLTVLGNGSMFPRLCNAMGRPDLIEHPKFIDNERRVQNRGEIEKIVEDWVATLTMEEAIETLLEFEVAHGPINSAADVYNDPHLWARESLVKVFDPELNEEIVVQNVIPKLSKTPGQIKWNGGAIGANNDEIFLEKLGLSPERYQELQDKGAI